jgi:uncharacterized membrane protein
VIVVLCVIAGAAIGAMVHRDGLIAGAGIGLLIGLVLRGFMKDSGRANAPRATAAPHSAPYEQRIARLEQRIDELEARLARADAVIVGDQPTTFAPEPTPQPARAAAAPSPDRTSVPLQADGTIAPHLQASVAVPPRTEHDALPTQPPPQSVAQARSDVPPERPRYGQVAATWAPPAAATAPPGAAVPTTPVAYDNPFARLWRWFTTGNVMTRVGVIILFFGVAFLLRYFAEHFDFSIQAKLAGVALAGLALTAAGWWLQTRRPGYALSLQGAGAGILYLTVFAALRLYSVIAPEVAFVLLIVVAALTVFLAWRADSQPLAALAVAGAFLAPFLVATSSGSPALLFGYFAVVNAVILALALGKAWRALNVLGFVFTFALGAFWGERFYRPEYFGVVEPFLLLFFLFYLAISILYALRESWSASAPVDAILVFGVPLIAFVLQTQLVEDVRYGAAWSAFTLAALYAILFAVLRRHAAPGVQLLARAFLALAVVFVTVGIPYAAQARWTSAWWALEAALAYWIGCRQSQPFTRWFALLVEIAAAAAFALADSVDADARAFLNPNFMGAAVIGIAGLATAYLADRHAGRLGALERALRPALLAWGAAWWLGAGVAEVFRILPRSTRFNAMLAWVAASSALAMLLRRPLRWPGLAAVAAFLGPAMIVAGANDLRISHTTVNDWGLPIWVFAWAILFWLLHTITPREEVGANDPRRLLAVAHVVVPVGLVAQIAWEASEWVGRVTEEGTVWIACAAALPAVAYLALMARVRDTTRWPVAAYRESYTVHAGFAMAALLAVWFVAVNVTSPGDAAPLPYVPILNPLDLTLFAALAATAYWMNRCADASERLAYRALGIGLFIALNGVVLRSAYHWLDLPWRLSALFANRPLQAALTLTWTATALPLMLFATRRGIRPLWMLGAALLAVVVVKLFAIDLGALSGLPRVVAFLGVGILLLVIGYVAPLPPERKAGEAAGPST